MTELSERRRKRESAIFLSILIPALTAWGWMLWELGKMNSGTAVISILMLLATGAIGHLVYERVWRWPGAAVGTALILHLAVLFALGGGRVSSLDLLWTVLSSPVEFVIWDIRHLDTMNPFDALIWAVIGLSLVLTSLHPLRPCFPTAMVSTLGISLWFLVSFTMMAHAG